MFNYTDSLPDKQVGNLPIEDAGADVRSTGVKEKPPCTDRGVEFLIDWITVTVWCQKDVILGVLEDVFGDILGKYKNGDHGQMGYRGVMYGLGGARLLFAPADNSVRITLIFPGQACSAIPPEFWIDLFWHLTNKEIRWNITRLDLAFDFVPFTPEDMYEAIEAGSIRSLAKRDSLEIISSPNKMRDTGGVKGCTTVYFGSRQSHRFLRVYNKRGYTRLELECKDKRAQLIGERIFSSAPGDWFGLAVSHLRDFLDVEREWWGEFVKDVGRAFAKVVNLVEVSVARLVSWFDSQIAPALSALYDCDPFIVDTVIQRGRRRRKGKYQSLVEAFSGG
jgi:DNA relaxase NicK